MDEEEIQHLQELKKKYIRNLRTLQLQEADYDSNVPLNIVNGINALEEKIQYIDNKLVAFESRSKIIYKKAKKRSFRDILEIFFDNAVNFKEKIDQNFSTAWKRASRKLEKDVMGITIICIIGGISIGFSYNYPVGPIIGLGIVGFFAGGISGFSLVFFYSMCLFIKISIQQFLER